MNLELDEVFAIIDKVKEAQLSAFCYQDADFKVSIKNSQRDFAGRSGSDARKRSGTSGFKGSGGGQARSDAYDARESDDARRAEKSPAGNEESSAAGENARTSVIEAPIVGTFYRAPSEGARPFVAVGDQVKKGQVVGIIEAMKLMNEIQSDKEGIIEEILAENEMMVEYGQPLFRLRMA